MNKLEWMNWTAKTDGELLVRSETGEVLAKLYQQDDIWRSELMPTIYREFTNKEAARKHAIQHAPRPV